MTSLNTRNSKVGKKETKKTKNENAYDNRQRIIQANQERQLPIHVHQMNLTNKEVKSTQPQHPYNR